MVATTAPHIRLMKNTVDTTSSAYQSFSVPTHVQAMLIDAAQTSLKVPIQLQLEQSDEGYWIATNPRILTYGTGDSIEAAMADFFSMLKDLFDELVNSENVLAPHLLEELEYLRTILVEHTSQD